MMIADILTDYASAVIASMVLGQAARFARRRLVIWLRGVTLDQD